MNITVLGCGRWGSFLAWYFNKIGYNVLLWGRNTSKNLHALKETRQNEYVFLPERIVLSNSISEALEFSQEIFIAIQEQYLRDFLLDIINEKYQDKIFVLCMKGLENSTGKRLSEVAFEIMGDSIQVAVMLGPGHPIDLVNGVPTCMIFDSNSGELKTKLVMKFNSNLIHFYEGEDLIGNEIGAAVSKIIGIAGGILDGLGLASLKGLLMVMGTKEIAALIEALGGKADSAYGICCLGDYQASVFSESSNSVAYGKSIICKKVFDKHAPGFFTAQTVLDIADQYSISLPLLKCISATISEGQKPIEIPQLLLKYCV